MTSLHLRTSIFVAYLENQKEVMNMFNNELLLSEKQMPASLVFVI